MEKDKANWEKNAEEQATKFAKGEGNFQLAAAEELHKRGIECVNATKAQSIYESIRQKDKFTKGEGNFQLAVAEELCQQGINIKCVDATKAESILE